MPAAGLDWTFRAMGTAWRIHHGGRVTGDDAQAVAEVIAADERRWSRFLPTSDVSRITAGAGSDVAVASDTVAIVRAAVDWSVRTDGAFQPLVGAQVRAWGYATRPGDAGAAPTATTVTDAGAIAIGERTVRIPPGTALDLGGIGKSWSAMRAAAALRDRTDDPRLVIDAGGDVLVVRGGEAVRTAAGPVRAGAGEGVATSSSERRSWVTRDGEPAHHLIDPATGAPGRRGTAVVIGRDAVEADVLATCVVLRPDLMHAIDVPAAHLDVDGAITANALWETRGTA